MKWPLLPIMLVTYLVVYKVDYYVLFSSMSGNHIALCFLTVFQNCDILFLTFL